MGPLLGGVLVDTVSWRMVFLINLPLVALGLWAVLGYVPESRDASASGHFDWLGAGLAAIAVGGLAFGATYGQQREWRDPLAFWSLGFGLLGCVAFPILMLRSHDPLVPPRLFRSRNFAVTNLATLVIYGALYVSLYYMPLFLQGTLGYTALAAGMAFMPGPLLLVFLSTRLGGLATRYGPRWFMATGPALMGLSFLWFARVPASSDPWIARPDVLVSFVPPVGYLLDVLPGSILLGLGLATMVSPLTAALMQSVPEENAGLASAINNAISRVGSPLASALMFVFITARFYGGLATLVPGLDPSDPRLRESVSPLNRPAENVPAVLAAATQQASTDVFHIAMFASAAMMFAGAATAALGIEDQARRPD